MVDLQGNIFVPPVGAGAAPLFEEVLPDLVAGQRSLLVFDAAYLRILHFLKVEPHQFLGKSGDGNEPPEAFDPGDGRVDPVAESRTSPSPKSPTLVQLLFDLRPPMTKFRPEEDVGGLFSVRLFLPDHGDAGGLRPGVDLDPNGLRLSSGPVFQPMVNGATL